MNIREDLKRRAADAAVEQVRSGMVLGLGSGTTVTYALQRLAELLRAGKIDNVCGVPSSTQTHQNTVFWLLVLMMAITGCVDPRISIFGNNGEPPEEYTLQGSTKGKVLLIPVKGRITDDIQSGLIRKKPSMVQEIVAQLKKAEKYENDTIYNMQSTWTGGEERLALVGLGLPASETSEIAAGFYYLWPTAADGR